MSSIKIVVVVSKSNTLAMHEIIELIKYETRQASLTEDNIEIVCEENYCLQSSSLPEDLFSPSNQLIIPMDLIDYQEDNLLEPFNPCIEFESSGYFEPRKQSPLETKNVTRLRLNIPP